MTILRSILFDPANQSSFGVLTSAEMTPVLQGDFVHGLNTQLWQTAVVSGVGAAVDTNAARLRVQSGTDAAGYAYILSRKPARYRAGEGIVWLATPIFATGTANNYQFAGMGAIAANVIYDGYGFSYNGTAFGISHWVRGTPAHTAQTAWNGDKCDGSAGSSFTLNPLTGSPMMIKYPYLGFGNIEFFIQNPTTGRFVLCHTIRYANTVATTQLSNPSLYFLEFILNSGNTTNRTMYCASYAAFISGKRLFVHNPKGAADASEAAVTTENVILSIRNATTYNATVNRGMIRLSSLAFSSSAATGIAIIRLKLGATIGGSPSFAPFNGTTGDNGVTITSGNSIASVDVAGTTVSVGTYIFGITVDNPNANFVDLVGYDIFIAPGETLTVSGYSSNASLLAATVTWTEDI